MGVTALNSALDLISDFLMGPLVEIYLPKGYQLAFVTQNASSFSVPARDEIQLHIQGSDHALRAPSHKSWTGEMWTFHARLDEYGYHALSINR